MTTIAERVAAGAAFLDEHDPQWWRADAERAIDLDTLELSDTARCILGQRCPVEVLGKSLGIDPADEDELSANWWEAYFAYAKELSGLRYGLDRWATEHAFRSDDGSEYDALTEEWRNVIAERRPAS